MISPLLLTIITFDAGTSFCGFQLQAANSEMKQQHTVQGQLERVLAQRLFENETTTSKNNNKKDWSQALEASLNRMLPDDIRVRNVQLTPPI